ncbi:hypothetical protein HPP92_016652 [Vanilla planifolia]|uniref:RNA helicase n=1 Tax=Vanilla planifolia TaxID=51239 RepID=A0A835UUE6_VANPL|nr:hypothetical protein HPP92_016652 [Vanilla planifolia]
MAAADAAQVSLGPSFAPEDPSLPKPWKGLIDGSTGVLYYWNPETNVTQYEKPAGTVPPLPPVPPDLTSLNVAIVPNSHIIPSNGSLTQPQLGQQMFQQVQHVQQQQQNQQHMPLQQLQQLPYQQQQPLQDQPPMQILQQPSQHFRQFQQLSYQQVPYMQGPLSSLPQGQVPYQSSQQVQTFQYSYNQGQQPKNAQQMMGKQLQESQPGHQLGQPVQGSHHSQQQVQQLQVLSSTPEKVQNSQSSVTAQQHGMDLYPQKLLKPQEMLQQGHLSQQIGISRLSDAVQSSQSPVTSQQHVMHSHGQSFLKQQEILQQGQQSQQLGLPRVVDTVHFSQSPVTTQQHAMHSLAHNFLKQQEMLQQGQQSQQIGLSRVGDVVHQEGNASSSSRLVQQAGNHQLSSLIHQAQIPQSGGNMIQQHQHHPIYPQNGISQSQELILESSHHQSQTGTSIFSNQIGHPIVHPPVGPKTGYEEALHERDGAEFYTSGRSEGPGMPPVQPKLAPLPLSHSHQDMRLGAGGIPLKFPNSGWPVDGAGILPGHEQTNRYGNVTFPNAVRPLPRMFGPPDSPNMSADAYRQRHEVTAMGDNIPAPFMTFESTRFPPEILREIHAAGFLSPTPIQAQTWPVALQSRDVVAIAKTGSGKTLGYLIPAFIHLKRCLNNPQYGPTVLILAPTRELATQIQEEATKFGRSSRISCTCLYGGAPKGPQLKEIDVGVDIVVATPGRLNDILEMGRINFRQVSFLVLDEADRMLDMGFEFQIRKIVNMIPSRRQTLMYTATWPIEVRKIAGHLLVNPVQVNIGSVDELVANKSITQYVEVVPQMDKQRRLEQILRSQERGTKIIIFCSTKKLCDQLARSIGRIFGAIAIHGDKSQTERDHVLNQFRTGKFPILVATDVAARGLDIKDIRVVINYDFPSGTEDYVHRIGRTGRAGATGISYTFFTDQDWKHAPELIKVLEGANQHVPPEVREMAVRGATPSSQRFPLPYGGMSRWDSGGNGGTRMDFSGGRGIREFGRVSGSGRGFGGHGGRSDLPADGRRGTRGPGFGRGGWGRNDRGDPHDRFQNADGRGRYDRRGYGDRTKGRGHDRSRSHSWSRSRSPSWSRSRSRSRSWSRSRSPSRSRSRSYDRDNQHQGREPPRRRRVSGFDAPLIPVTGAKHQESEAPYRFSGFDAPVSCTTAIQGHPESEPPLDAPLVPQMSPMSPGNGDDGAFAGVENGN